MHANFSTTHMREVGGKEYFEKLMAAFDKRGQDGLLDALQKADPVARLKQPGFLGLRYIFILPGRETWPTDGTMDWIYKECEDRNIPLGLLAKWAAGNMSPEELSGASAKSCSVLDGLGNEIQWIHSYVTGDKIYCVYIAPDEAAGTAGPAGATCAGAASGGSLRPSHQPSPMKTPPRMNQRKLPMALIFHSLVN